MQPLTVAEIVKATKGTLVRGDENVQIDYITTDSRKANAGLFVPLAGESFDGHTFLDSAFSNGADAAVTEKILTGVKMLSGWLILMLPFVILQRFIRKNIRLRQFR